MKQSLPAHMRHHARRETRWLILVACACSAFATGCVEIRVQDPDVRFIAFGDSTTDGPSARDYPDILREMLGEPPNSFTNEGVGGETTSEGLRRLSRFLDGDLFPNATVLLYWQGGSDIIEFIAESDRLLLFSPDDEGYPFTRELDAALDDTQDNIEDAIAIAREAGLDVFVATFFSIPEDVPDCPALPLDTVVPAQARVANEYLLLLNERIAAAADRAGAVLVDVAAEDPVLRADMRNYFNCNHLSARGNEIAAQVFFDAMTSAN